ncbi:uncharacterized protein LOC132629158 [Lycium barbarum]|uniref:uncharacterized protein LOC132629158 n=1 Tax=Lycium barbarum TaxID=112863 RepID=UPI00293EAE48|nr:uncharacterized protein LOC132629158 [Lycium barbarum]
MGDIIDGSQAAFVPRRVITDNILLSHELVKGYTRKGVSARCMIKIDMQKAYDSLEWGFLEQVLVVLNFPVEFEDVESVRLLFEKFTMFSQSSGLNANLGKSCIYFGGVKDQVQSEILGVLGMSKGSMPLRYLGVPLSTKRVSIAQCQPLLDKMLSRVKSWTTKLLSCAGSLLIKSVLFCIQVFWAQVFVLPKKIVEANEATLRTFLWTGGTAL